MTPLETIVLRQSGIIRRVTKDTVTFLRARESTNENANEVLDENPQFYTIEELKILHAIQTKAAQRAAYQRYNK